MALLAPTRDNPYRRAVSDSKPKPRTEYPAEFVAESEVDTICPNCGARKMVPMTDAERIERMAAAGRVAPPIPMPCALHAPSKED